MTDTTLSALQQSIVASLGDLTLAKTGHVGLRHAEANREAILRGIDDLNGKAEGRSAIVIAAGPSLHQRQTIRRIRESTYDGVIVATDGGLGHCLREGLVPDYVVSVDSHAERIVRWFGDPDLASRPPDDYFSRQDLDPEFMRDAYEVNARTLALVDAHGPRITAVLATSVAPTVRDRVLQAGMPVYWWHPIYDDPDAPGSLTRQVHAIAPVPAMIAGGNCGTAAWVFAGAVLHADTVALVGMDLSYRPGTPLTHTQYYSELRAAFGDRFAEAYIEVTNPHLGETWFTDPTYWWYREAFLELARLATFRTVNCTEGGILFGDGVTWDGLDRFLSR